MAFADAFAIVAAVLCVSALLVLMLPPLRCEDAALPCRYGRGAVPDEPGNALVPDRLRASRLWNRRIRRRMVIASESESEILGATVSTRSGILLARRLQGASRCWRLSGCSFLFFLGSAGSNLLDLKPRCGGARAYRRPRSRPAVTLGKLVRSLARSPDHQ